MVWHIHVQGECVLSRAQPQTIPVTVMGAFSDRGQEAPVDFIAYAESRRGTLARSSLLFLAADDTIATFHLIISGYPAATDGVYHPLSSFAEYRVACCEDEGGRTSVTWAPSLKLRRPTEALAEVGANGG